MGKASNRFHSSIAFCICGRLFKFISFTFVWERETLAAVHSTHDYGFFSNIVCKDVIVLHKPARLKYPDDLISK